VFELVELNDSVLVDLGLACRVSGFSRDDRPESEGENRRAGLLVDGASGFVLSFLLWNLSDREHVSDCDPSAHRAGQF
jgi:hypothetical protein